MSLKVQKCENGYRIGDNSDNPGNGFTGNLGETLIIPSIIGTSNIVEVGKTAFRYAEPEYLIIEEGVKILSESCFRAMPNLKHVSLPLSITKIGLHAFDDSKQLETVQINQPSKLVEIGEASFSTAEKLKSFVIPSSVEFIGNYSFEEIENTIIYYCGRNSFMDKNISGLSSNIQVFVPKGGVKFFGGIKTKIEKTPCLMSDIRTCGISFNQSFRYSVAIFILFINV